MKLNTVKKMNFSLVAIGDQVVIDDEVKTVLTVETLGDRRSRKKLKVPKFNVCFEGDEEPTVFSWHDEIEVVVPE